MNLVQLLTKNKATLQETMGGGFIDRIEANYFDLVDRFGLPHFEGSPDGKVNAEWAYMLDRKTKTVVTIYNYKSTRPVEQETDWHIGGRGDHELIRDWIEAVFNYSTSK